MPRIAILAASRRELAPVYAALEPLERRRSISIERRPGLYEVRQAGEVEVYLLKTGMGPRAAADAARALLADVTVDAVVSTGYAGALGSAGIGEVILGTDVSAWTKDMSDWTQGPDRAIFRVAPDLLAMARDAAKEAALAWSEGSVDTVDRVLWRADEKRALADASGAIAVDMESAAIARVALDKQAPFLLVRAVSDRADETLPMDFNLWLTPGERWLWSAGVRPCPRSSPAPSSSPCPWSRLPPHRKPLPAIPPRCPCRWP